jgi:hypothetical protein
MHDRPRARGKKEASSQPPVTEIFAVAKSAIARKPNQRRENQRRRPTAAASSALSRAETHVSLSTSHSEQSSHSALARRCRPTYANLPFSKRNSAILSNIYRRAAVSYGKNVGFRRKRLRTTAPQGVSCNGTAPPAFLAKISRIPGKPNWERLKGGKQNLFVRVSRIPKGTYPAQIETSGRSRGRASGKRHFESSRRRFGEVCRSIEESCRSARPDRLMEQ